MGEGEQRCLGSCEIPSSPGDHRIRTGVLNLRLRGHGKVGVSKPEGEAL